jgi:hypothetical protein
MSSCFVAPCQFFFKPEQIIHTLKHGRKEFKKLWKNIPSMLQPVMDLPPPIYCNIRYITCLHVSLHTCFCKNKFASRHAYNHAKLHVRVRHDFPWAHCTVLRWDLERGAWGGRGASWDDSFDEKDQTWRISASPFRMNFPTGPSSVYQFIVHYEYL